MPVNKKPVDAVNDKARPDPEELPGTLRRSDEKAQRTYAAAHDSAVETYGEGRRARQVAFAAVKHTHEKVGDHWEPKERSGPSDPRAVSGGPDGDEPTAGGVDANSSKAHLADVAKRLGVPGRSSMNKAQLVEAIRKANNRATAQARKP